MMIMLIMGGLSGLFISGESQISIDWNGPLVSNVQTGTFVKLDRASVIHSHNVENSFTQRKSFRSTERAFAVQCPLSIVAHYSGRG
jgi:hypothetical protein